MTGQFFDHVPGFLLKHAFFYLPIGNNGSQVIHSTFNSSPNLIIKDLGVPLTIIRFQLAFAVFASAVVGSYRCVLQ
jgi:hypothetical protein